MQIAAVKPTLAIVKDANPIQTIPNEPSMWRVGAVAKNLFGLSEEAFVDACDRGDLEIEVVRVGPRNLRLVRSAQVLSYLRQAHPSQTTKVTHE